MDSGSDSESHRSFGAWLALVARSLLGGAAALLVLWSFFHVGRRELGRLTAGDGRRELVVMHWSGDAGPEEDAIVEDTLARFEAANPEVAVRRINPGDAPSFYTKLQTMMAAGEPPDVFYVGYERVAAFASLGLLEDLDAYVAAEASATDANTVRLDDYYGSVVDSFRFDGERVGDGPLYGIPKDFTSVGFYVNVELLARAGETLPPDDWTWDDFERIARAVGALEGKTGAEFVTWPYAVRAYLMTEGLDLIGDGFDDLRLDDPAVRSALERFYGWRHEESGTLTSGSSNQVGNPSVFMEGDLGMAGPFGRWMVPTYRLIPSPPDGGFTWDFVPLPRGTTATATPSNVALSVAWGISSASEAKDDAWSLVRFLCGPETQGAQSELGLAIPAQRSLSTGGAFFDADLPPANDAGYLAGAEVAEVVRWPADPRFEDLLGSRLDQALKTGDVSVAGALDNFDQAWAQSGASPFARADFPALNWRVAQGIGGALLLLSLILFARLWFRPPASQAAREEERAGFALVSPWVLGFALFMAMPIGLSLVLSFARWKGVAGLEQAEFVGLANYEQLLAHDDRFRVSLRVTAYYALLAVPGAQVLALLAAILMNQKVRGIPFFRAAWYLPSVLAGVGIAILWKWVFDADAGLLNNILEPLLAPLGWTPPEWFGRDAAIWGAPAFALMSLWLVGGSMLIYLAGLQGIPEELYEAAEIDGAGPLARFRCVTLPMLGPVILFNLIMAIIGSFQVFTQAFVMTGGEPGDLTRFYVLYLYNQAFEFYEMGYASAMAWILLLIVLALTVFVMRTSARHVYYEALQK